jgi:hypothetical protein
MDMDYRIANTIARSVASLVDADPTVVAWHDGIQNRMSPVIEGANILNRWSDYGTSHGGNLNVSINGDYDFIFADGEQFEQLGNSPYMSLQDAEGNQFLCRIGDLRDPHDPHQQACFSIEEDSTPSSMHAG